MSYSLLAIQKYNKSHWESQRLNSLICGEFIFVKLWNEVFVVCNFLAQLVLEGLSIKYVMQKTRLLIVGGGRVNGESMFPGPSNGETLGEL